MKNRKILYIAVAAALYVVLIVVLTANEAASPGSNITNVGDSLWYSLVTLTTVGYGDFYPVSAAGRIIGVIFILLSPGIFAAVILAAVDLIRSRIVPYFRLQAIKGKSLCVFSEYNEASKALASDILKNAPDKKMIFCNSAGKDPGDGLRRNKSLIFVPDEIKETAAVLSGGRGDMRIFLISEDPSENLHDADALKDNKCEIYCRAQEISDAADIRFFDADQCCARLYWREHPLKSDERVVVIAGDGQLAKAILDQAVFVNCRIPFERTTYHIFGNWEQYRCFHPGLWTVFSDDENEAQNDSLIFHDEAWNKNTELLSRSDRIIFCSDSGKENADNAVKAGKYYALKAGVYAAAEKGSVPGEVFGGAEDIFTEELVVRRRTDKLARALHEEYISSTGAAGPGWDELTPFLKNSNRAAADHLLTKLRLLSGDEARTVDEETCNKGYEIWSGREDKESFRRNEHER